MIGMTIKAIRIDNWNVKRNDKGSLEVSATYALISSKDTVLAEQSVGGYNGLKVVPSQETAKALQAFVDSYQKDVEGLLGFGE